MSADHFTKILNYDGAIDAVFTYRTQPDTVAGTVWRFIMDRGKALGVIPYQTPKAPAPEAHCVPVRIESVLAGDDEDGQFAYAVHVAALVSENNAPQDWETEIQKAADQEFKAWRDSKQWPKGSASDKVRAEQDAAWKKIEAGQRKKIEKHKAAYMKRAESAAMKELAESVAAYGVKRPSAAATKALYTFIREDVCSGNTQNPWINALALQRIAQKAGELIKVSDFAERVMLAYCPDMPEIVREWSGRTAAAESLSEEAARARFMDRVRFMALFPDGLRYPVESLTLCVHDAKDSKAFRRVDISPGDRALIAAKVEAKREELRSEFIAARLKTRPISFGTQESTHPSKPIYMDPEDLRKEFGWSGTTIDTYVEQGRLTPIRDEGPVKGGKRGKKRRFLREQAEKIWAEDRQKIIGGSEFMRK